MSSNKQSLLEPKKVHGIKPIKLNKNIFRANSLKKKRITRIGETTNFVVDYDSTESLILLYGKEAPTSHGFKLGFDKEEAAAVINLLRQAKTLQ